SSPEFQFTTTTATGVIAAVYRLARLFRGRATCHDEAMLRRARPLALLLLVLAGCAGPSGRRDVGGWLQARGADFMAIFGVRLGVGIGLGVYVRATEWAQLGLMWRGPSETSLVGPGGTAHDESFRVRGLPCAMFGTIGRYGGLWTESSREIM